MALPDITAITQAVTVELDSDIAVTFNLCPIPGSVYNDLIDAHRDTETGKAPHDDIAEQVLLAGISTYQTGDDELEHFVDEDATAIWTEWPDHARWNLYHAVTVFSTKGPGNPFDKLNPKGKDD